MSERVIHAADLSCIESNLRAITNNINVVNDNLRIVHNQVVSVNDKVNEVDDRVEVLQKEFSEFVRRDMMAKALQLAETRVVKVRQELEKRFGYHDEVRRCVTGILQAVDANIIRNETIRNATEELMLSTPKYWLTPSLVALSAWLNDNKELAERAMNEALRRDAEKTSLFFTLICRRGERMQSAELWLEHYFGQQDPADLNRHAVVVINAYASGLFGTDAKGKCASRINEWIKELSEKVGFVEEQQAQWEKAFSEMVPEYQSENYHYLSLHSPTWGSLENSLNEAKLNEVIKNHFTKIFNSDEGASYGIKAEADNILDNLVTEFDEEELPLRKEERKLHLIIEEQGDTNRAERRFDLEYKSFNQRKSFTQIMTDAAMNPQNTNASKATQKLSTALSFDWIKKAYEDLTAKNRNKVPLEIDLVIDEWKGTTCDGANENELTVSLKNFFENKKQLELNKIKITGRQWAALIGGILLALVGLADSLFVVLLGLGGVGYFIYSKLQIPKKKARIESDYSSIIENAQNILKACLAEVVDWGNEYAQEDAKYDEVIKLFEGITPEQFISSKYTSGRAIYS